MEPSEVRAEVTNECASEYEVVTSSKQLPESISGGEGMEPSESCGAVGTYETY